MTVTMLNEMERVKENAEKVDSMRVPQLPMLLFISDGSGETGFDKETWRKILIQSFVHRSIQCHQCMDGGRRFSRTVYQNTL